MKFLLCFFLFSCNSGLYYWGTYEKDLIKRYTNPQKITITEEILNLETTINKAQEKEKKIPPGIYAHLASLYSSIGNKDQAYRTLKKEKKLFPESSVFIDGIIRRINKK